PGLSSDSGALSLPDSCLRFSLGCPIRKRLKPRLALARLRYLTDFAELCRPRTTLASDAPPVRPSHRRSASDLRYPDRGHRHAALRTRRRGGASLPDLAPNRPARIFSGRSLVPGAHP